MARGTRGGNKSGPFLPSDFDVDAFIVSDELAQFFSNRFRTFRKTSELTEFGVTDIVNSIDEALRANPVIGPDLRPDPFDFRIFTQFEINDLLATQVDEVQEFIGR